MLPTNPKQIEQLQEIRRLAGIITSLGERIFQTVTLNTAQTVVGNKNFVGNLQKDGVNVLTENSLENIVLKEEGKGLSENDLTDSLKEAYDLAVTVSHAHTNKEILDAITAAFTTEQETKLAGLQNYDDTVIVDAINQLQTAVNLIAIQTIKVNGNTITPIDGVVDIPLNAHLAPLFKDIELSVLTKTLHFTKHDNSYIDIDLTPILPEAPSFNGIAYLKDPEKTYLVIKIPADNDTFELLTGPTGSPNYTIEWGDGVSETITTTDNPEHEYATAGMYLITISGTFDNGIVVGTGASVNKNKIIEVYGGSNYTSIGEYAFNYCSNLTTVNLPLVTSINDSAFHECQSLTTVHFPKVTSIGHNAFQGCTSLTTANFPSATSIGHNAFWDCSKLTTAYFPKVTSIGNSAFYGCTSLTTANFPSATSIGEIDFASCTNLTTVHFPSATSIGHNAFYGCTSLTTAYFPLVTSIGANAFWGCTSLKELTLGNVQTTGIGIRFTDVKLVNLKIAQDVDTTDIDRIKQFYADNGGTFSNAYELKHGLQVSKTPTLDNDVVRKIDLTSAIGDINTILDEINGEVL